MPKRRPIDFAVLRSLITPRQALEACGWRPVWVRGLLSRGPCPIHRSGSEQSRSLSVTDRVVYCHKCHWTGDAVALWARLHDLTVLEAAYDLCDRLGRPIPFLHGERTR